MKVGLGNPWEVFDGEIRELFYRHLAAGPRRVNISRQVYYNSPTATDITASWSTRLPTGLASTWRTSSRRFRGTRESTSPGKLKFILYFYINIRRNMSTCHSLREDSLSRVSLLFRMWGGGGDSRRKIRYTFSYLGEIQSSFTLEHFSIPRSISINSRILVHTRTIFSP